MVGVTEDVLVIVDMIDYASPKLNKLSYGISNLKKREVGLDFVLGKAGIKDVDYMSTGLKNMESRMNKARKMVLMGSLSTLFFGMTLQRVTSGLLDPALKLAGVFEVIGTTLEILLLPAALWLLENVFLPILDFVAKLPEDTREKIGFIIIGIAALGAALVTLGTIGSAVVGLNTLISLLGLSTGAGTAATLTGAAGASALAVGALVGALALFAAAVGIVAIEMDSYKRRLAEHPATASALSPLEQNLGPLGLASAGLRSDIIDALSQKGVSDKAMAGALTGPNMLSLIPGFAAIQAMAMLGQLGMSDADKKGMLEYMNAEDSALRAGMSREQFINSGYSTTPNQFFNFEVAPNLYVHNTITGAGVKASSAVESSNVLFSRAP